MRFYTGKCVAITLVPIAGVPLRLLDGLYFERFLALIPPFRRAMIITNKRTGLPSILNFHLKTFFQIVIHYDFSKVFIFQKYYLMIKYLYIIFVVNFHLYGNPVKAQF